MEINRELVRQYARQYEEIIHSGKDVKNLTPAINAFDQWYEATLVLLSRYFDDSNSDFKYIKEQELGNGYVRYNVYTDIRARVSMLLDKTEIMESNTASDALIMTKPSKKKYKVFISHSSKDKEFVEALVDLFEGLGMTPENLFCSSVPEYGIKLGGDIFEILRKLFHEFELYMIFVHSPRYYNSTVSLNEMGAAWVLHTKCCSILTADMDFSNMNGVINGNFISIKVNQEDATARLNELKAEFTRIFSLPDIEINKWERKRNNFLRVVNAMEPIVEQSAIQASNLIDEEYKRLQIEKMNREAEDLKKAIIRGNIVKGSKPGERTLRFFNAGKAEARNVQVEWLNDADGVYVNGDFSQIGNLLPQSNRTYHIVLCNNASEMMNLRYTWEDDFNQLNMIEEQLQL